MKAKKLFMLLLFLIAPLSKAQPPSLILMEFIGQWEEIDGDWVDPMSIELDNDDGSGSPQTFKEQRFIDQESTEVGNDEPE